MTEYYEGQITREQFLAILEFTLAMESFSGAARTLVCVCDEEDVSQLLKDEVADRVSEVLGVDSATVSIRFRSDGVSNES